MEKNEKAAEQPLQLTAKDLKELISSAVSAAVAEAKKPVVTDAEKAAIEQAQQDRKQTAQQKLDEINAKKFNQKVCQHEGGKPTHPHTVYVQDDWGGYILCQLCGIVVRPENSAAKTTNAVYDTALFNRLFQKSGGANGVIF